MSDTYPEYTTNLEAENKRLQEEVNDLVAALKLLASRATYSEENTTPFKNAKELIAKHTPEAQGSRKEILPG